MIFYFLNNNIEGVYFFSVLEQFAILKFPLTLGFFNFFFNDSLKFFFLSFIEYKLKKGLYILRKFFQIIYSFFIPNGFSTKNYVYGRITIFLIKNYFRLFVKKKILVFWRCNFQVLKVKFQLKFQQTIKSNFGLHYPFYNRLLNYYPFLVVIFSLIFFHNINGLLFYGFTNTAFLLQNFALSGQALWGLFFLGLSLRSYDFYKMFVPSGVPLILLPFLIVIEVISYGAKVLSLAIRLFANMMSGHVLLHILTGFVLKLGKLNLLLLFFPILILIVIFFLEYGIAFLQAYVFVILLAIYFEEHFGFSVKDKTEISKLISINGRESFTIRHTFAYSIAFRRLRARSRFWYVGSYQNKRRKTRFMRCERFWDLTVLTCACRTRKR